MKRFLSLVLIALMMITVLFVSIACNDEEPTPQPEPQPQVTQYTVTFVNNGGTPKLDPVTVNEGATISKTKKVVTKEGYTLLGWYTDADFKTEFVFKKTEVKSDLTLYAKWVDTTTYQHSDPILPAGSVKLNNNAFTIPLTWSPDEKGWTATGRTPDLPPVTYSFAGERTDVTNVSAELKEAIATATADPTFFDDTPTNIIFLFSDGWGVTEVNMSREYKGELLLDSLPYATESKTDSYKKYIFKDAGKDQPAQDSNYTDHTTTDSCAGGTQVLAGYKTRYGYIAIDVDANPVENLIEAAHRMGYKTANVTNDNIVDATPADAMIHDTNRYHSDVLYYKALKYALAEQGLDLLMGWDWGMSTYFKNADWADKFKSAEIEGIKDAVSNMEITAYGGEDPITYFKTTLTTAEDKAKMAGFSVYYALYENELDSRLNSFLRWATTGAAGAAELADYIAWLGDGKTGSGLATAIANVSTYFGGNDPSTKVKRFTDFGSVVKNTDFSKPILGSWTSDGNKYESASPNRGYLLNGTIGKQYPSWPEMVAYTIYQLDAESNAGETPTGFFCIIENTCTDGWGHAQKGIEMLDEVQCFDEGVAIAVKYVLEHPDTLLVVSADHETGGFILGKNWETDITMIYSDTDGHSSQRVPLYAFGAGAQNFSAEAIATKYASHPNAGLEEDGKIHEGWITGALMGELMTGEPFGLTVKDGTTKEKTYNGKGFTMSGTLRYGAPLWAPAAVVWTPAE